VVQKRKIRYVTIIYHFRKTMNFPALTMRVFPYSGKMPMTMPTVSDAAKLMDVIA
jgi:hypothetical protein